MTPEKMRLEMLRIRMIEEAISKRYPEQKMRTPVHLSIGQEAAAVGVCAALNSDDLVVSTHRSHAHYLAKGGDLNAFIAELHGKATGCSGGFGGSMHLTSLDCGFVCSTSIVGGTIPVGVGLAFAKKYKDEPGIVVIFHGDAAVEEGVWHESVNFAVLHKLPVLFVCENNGFSCYTPLKDRQPRNDFRDLSFAHGLNYSWITGEPELIRNEAQRLKSMPSLLEIETKRWYEHCGVKKEVDGHDMISDLDGSQFKEEIDAAFKFAEESAWPEPMEMLCP